MLELLRDGSPHTRIRWPSTFQICGDDAFALRAAAAGRREEPQIVNPRANTATVGRIRDATKQVTCQTRTTEER